MDSTGSGMGHAPGMDVSDGTSQPVAAVQRPWPVYRRDAAVNEPTRARGSSYRRRTPCSAPPARATAPAAQTPPQNQVLRCAAPPGFNGCLQRIAQVNLNATPAQIQAASTPARSLPDGFTFGCVRNDPKLMGILSQMLHVEDPRGLCGADRPHARHSQLKLVNAWLVHNPSLRALYMTRQAKVKQDIQRLGQRPFMSPGDYTSTHSGPLQGKRCVLADAYSQLPGTLDASVNEVRLLHGTAPGIVLNIAAEGMNERLSGSNAGTLYGEGTYLADVADKIDQYAVADDGNHPELHRRIFAGMPRPDFKHGEICYAFVCRATLGYFVRTKEGKTSMDPPHAQLFPTTKRELGFIEHSNNAPKTAMYHSLIAEVGGLTKRHREYVLFHAGSSCYPEYLVAYRRV